MDARYILILMLLVVWAFILRAMWIAVSADTMEKFLPPAAFVAISSPFFMGPLCLVLWLVLLFRLLSLRG